jgi:hypothetical protein
MLLRGLALIVGFVAGSTSRSACQASCAACIRIQMPAPAPQSLPNRAAIFGVICAHSAKISSSSASEIPSAAAVPGWRKSSAMPAKRHKGLATEPVSATRD